MFLGSFTRHGSPVIGGAIALLIVAVCGVSSANATVIDTYNLDTLNAPDVGLENYGPVTINGIITKAPGGISIVDGSLDPGDNSTAVSGSGTAFAFDYLFTVSTPSGTADTVVNIADTGQILGLAISLIDVTLNQTVAYGTGSPGLSITGWNLVVGHQYEVAVTGNASLPTNSATAIFNGSIATAVPLPGTLAMVIPGLVGLFGIGSRRRKTTATFSRFVSVGTAVAATMVLSVTMANATTVETSNIGVIPVTPTGSNFFLNGTVTGGGTIKSYGYYVGELHQAGSLSGSGSDLTFAYNFSVNAPSALNIYLYGSPVLTSALGTASTFKLLDLTAITSLTSTVTGNSLTLTSSLKPTDLYKLVVSLPSTIRGSTVNATGTISATPIPGALLLFGSGFAVLALGGRARNKKTSQTGNL